MKFMWVYTSDILGNETLEFDGVWKRRLKGNDFWLQKFQGCNVE